MNSLREDIYGTYFFRADIDGILYKQRVISRTDGGRTHMARDTQVGGKINKSARYLRARVSLGEVGSVSSDAVSHEALLHVILVGQAEVFLRRKQKSTERRRSRNHASAQPRTLSTPPNQDHVPSLCNICHQCAWVFVGTDELVANDRG